MKSKVVVRKAAEQDADVMLQLIDALAAYEDLSPPDEGAKERLKRDCFGSRPRFELLLADVDGKSVGYAFIFETYSSFLALPTMYLEDIFVLPEYRGVGAGIALFRRVVAEAEKRGCGRVDWQVLNWNKLAIDFYERIGAKQLSNWLTYRLTADQFAEIAHGKKEK